MRNLRIEDWVKFDLDKALSYMPPNVSDCWNYPHVLQIKGIINNSFVFESTGILENGYIPFITFSNNKLLFIKATKEEIRQEKKRLKSLKISKL